MLLKVYNCSPSVKCRWNIMHLDSNAKRVLSDNLENLLVDIFTASGVSWTNWRLVVEANGLEGERGVRILTLEAAGYAISSHVVKLSWGRSGASAAWRKDLSRIESWPNM